MSRAPVSGPRPSSRGRSALLAVGLLVLALLCCSYPTGSADPHARAVGETSTAEHAAGDHHGGDHHHHAGCTMLEVSPTPSPARAESTESTGSAVSVSFEAGPSPIIDRSIRAKGPPPIVAGRDLLHQLSVLRT